MTFESIEQSVQDAAPIILVKFIGSFTTYRYTTYPEDVITSDGAYTTIGYMSISEISKSLLNDNKDNSIEITFKNGLGEGLPLIDAYVKNTSPPKLEVEVIRFYTDTEKEIIFSGDLNTKSGELSDTSNDIVLNFIHESTKMLKMPFPPLSVERNCPHVLYDTRCGVVKSQFTATTTIATVIDDLNFTVVSIETPLVASPADQYFKVGYLQTSTEKREIRSQVGTLITISDPFITTPSSADPVELVAGCDKLVTTCHSKFDNLYNNNKGFLGFPNIPTDNIFAKGIKG